MTTLRLIADDLTGPLDTAAEFLGPTSPVSAFSHGAIPSALPANAAPDSGARELDTAAATPTVAALTPAVEGADIAFKKIDSLLRGATLAEVAVCMRAREWRHAMMAPTFPYRGRVTRDGVQYTRDAPSNWSAVDGDIADQRQHPDALPRRPLKAIISNLPITGVFCAAVTPVTADLSPDYPAFVSHSRRLLDPGCDGIALPGTPGEANSFSPTERKVLLEAALAADIPADRLLPGTGVAAWTETAELTRHALSLGVTRVVMQPPFYYKGISDNGLSATYAAIGDRVADPHLRIVLYHIPQFSAVPITFRVIERLRARFPDTFGGIKDSSGDLENMIASVEWFTGLAVLTGADTLMLLRKRGAGCITATSNLIASELATIFRHHADPERADQVDAAQSQVVAPRTRVSPFAQIASIKTLTARNTGHAGWTNVRPPLRPLSPAEAAQL